MDGSSFKQRLLPISLCVVSVAACFAYASMRSGLPEWWRNHGGGVPYVLFWITLWYAVFPRRKYIVAICVGCALFTCLLEFLQAAQLPEILENFRRTKFGAAWLGYGYDFRDIPPYFLGGIAGWLLLVLISRHKPNESERTSSDLS